MRKLIKLYQEGGSRVKNSLQMDKLVMSLRDIKWLVKAKLLDNATKLRMNLNPKRFIDIDSEPELQASQPQIKT